MYQGHTCETHVMDAFVVKRSTESLLEETTLHALAFAALVLWFFRAKHRASIPAAMIAAALVGIAIGAFAA